MNPLNKYSIVDNEWFRYTSQLCGTCLSLDVTERLDVSLHITELTQSYFNQWQFAILLEPPVETRSVRTLCKFKFSESLSVYEYNSV